MDEKRAASGSLIKRLLSTVFLLPAWFAPHSRLRVIFHRLRGVKIGKGVEIGYFCTLDNVHPDLVTIEDGVVIVLGSILLAHDNAYHYTYGAKVKCGPVVVKKEAFIGAGVVVMPNVTVGERAIVGANSVVIRDIPSDTIVGGVPAKIIKENPFKCKS